MPTPVSALIHAATLVTAGVYLLLRSSPVIEYGPTTLIVITWVGALTAFFAASTGLLQNDLKRVIAYSTCSQIGYLFMACGLSQYNVALFHLVNHAFFKALLFLAAGAVLHATYDQQDQRRLGGLIGFLPFTYTAILIGSLSLMALPWLTGFYSKDLILEVAYGQYEFSGQVAYWLGTLSACLTAFYSLRLISLTFLTYPNASKSVYLHTHDAPTIVMIPLIILSLLAIFFGYVARDLFVGMGSDFLSPSLFTHPSHISLIEAEFSLSQVIKLLPAVLTLVGAGSALYFYHVIPNFLIQLTNNPLGQKLYRFFNGKYFVDVIYNHYIINGGLQLGYTISKVLDRGIIELVGPHGLATGLSSGSKDIAKLDTGNLTSYALYLAVVLVSLLLVLISPALFNESFIDVRLILVIMVGIVSLGYITYNENTNTPLFSSNGIIISMVFPVVFIQPEMSMEVIFIGGFGGFGTMTVITLVSDTVQSKTMGEIVVETLENNMLTVKNADFLKEDIKKVMSKEGYKKAKETLIAMIDSLPKDSPVLKCILENYKKENVLFFEKDNITGEIVPKFEYIPSVSKSSAIPELYNGGVYMWKSIHTPKMFSIGGTLQLFSRFRSQYKELGQGKGRVTLFRWAKENGGLKSLQWFPLIFTVSFETIFYTVNPNYQCSIGEDKILKAISHFSPFTLENSMMLHFKPTVNLPQDTMLLSNISNGIVPNFLLT